MNSTRSRPLALALIALMLCLGSACGGGDDGTAKDRDKPTSGTTTAPEHPTFYMDFAVKSLANAAPQGRLPWQPVVQDGRRWTGDPKRYEQACGADFLTADGTLPELNSTRAGTDQSYYKWLQADTARWAAFNAWLQDPAVEAAVEPNARDVDTGYGAKQEPTGDASGCKDPQAASDPG